MKIQAGAKFRSCLRVRGNILGNSNAKQILRGKDFDEVIKSATDFYPDNAPSQILDLPWLWPSNYLKEIQVAFRKNKPDVEDFNRPRFTCTADGNSIRFKTVIVPVGRIKQHGSKRDRLVDIESLHQTIGIKAANQLKKIYYKTLKAKRLLNKQVSSKRPSYLWVHSEECKHVTFSAELTTALKKAPAITFVFFLHISPIPEAYAITEKRELLLFVLSLPAIVAGDEISEVCNDDLSSTNCERMIIQYQENHDPLLVFNS